MPARSSWSEKRQLYFNPTQHMAKIILHVHQDKHRRRNDRKVDNTPKTEKDLVVTFDRSLKFRQHIGTVVKKANQMIGLVKHTFKHMDCVIFRLLYKTLVRPYLDYADSTWNPHYVIYINALENTHRRATKLDPELRIHRRPKHVNLPSLVYRSIGGIIQTYKIVHSIDDINKDDFFTTNTQSTRSHKEKR